MMNKILNMIVKGLSVAMGPFGFGGEMYLRYIDETSSERREEELKRLIDEGKTVSRKTLEEILVFKEEKEVSRQQIISGILGILEVRSLNQMSYSNFNQIESDIPDLIKENKNIFEKVGFVNEEILIKEITELYSDDTSQFIQVIRISGFNIAKIPHGKNTAFNTTIYHFIKELQKSYTLNKQCKIINKLSEDCPNSKPLHVYRELINERLDNYG